MELEVMYFPDMFDVSVSIENDITYRLGRHVPVIILMSTKYLFEGISKGSGTYEKLIMV